jgi:Mrp family chromosome partitioning ATPase
LLSLIGGCLAGVALAALLERFDHGLRTSNDVTAATDLRCLGLVPELLPDDPALTAASRFAIASAQIVFYEAVRVVASSVGLFGSGHGDGGRIVLVTSAVPGEGRSTLCAGLARSLSLTGRRVLLIDGPPCRFDQTGPREPGPGSPQTSDAGPQQAKPAEGALVVLQRKSAAGFALDVFGSPRLGPALEEARRHFDVILIEGPPIMLIADALVLGRIADIVIHVARWADTKRRTVHAAVQRMEEHGVIVDGVVLMRVDVEKHAKLNLGDHGSYHLRPHDYYERAAQPAGGHLAAVMREPGSKSQHMFDEDAAKHGSARGPNTRKLG